MAFKLDKIVPWGRSLGEYEKFFNLSASDLDKRILSVADGPSSFNADLTKLSKEAVSYDPIYAFSVGEIQRRIDETIEVIKTETRENASNFVWKEYKDPDELFAGRLTAMNLFLEDLDAGKREYTCIIEKVPYEYQKGGNEMLRIMSNEK